MQIGILEIQQHHPPNLVEILQKRGEGHLCRDKNGVKPTSMLGGQGIVGVVAGFSYLTSFP